MRWVECGTAKSSISYMLCVHSEILLQSRRKINFFVHIATLKNPAQRVFFVYIHQVVYIQERVYIPANEYIESTTMTIYGMCMETEKSLLIWNSMKYKFSPADNAKNWLFWRE
jgi:hypothetical protein